MILAVSLCWDYTYQIRLSLSPKVHFLLTEITILAKISAAEYFYAQDKVLCLMSNHMSQQGFTPWSQATRSVICYFGVVRTDTRRTQFLLMFGCCEEKFMPLRAF